MNGFKSVKSCIVRSTTVLTLALAATSALAQPGAPVFIKSWNDCKTNNNKFVGSDGLFHWDVDANCDIYQNDRYERPMTQTFYSTVGRYGAREYFEYLDIHRARAGFDNTYLYVQIELAGRRHLLADGTIDTKGLVERYGFRMSTNKDGRNGVLIVSDQPELKNAPNTSWGPIGTFGYRDTDGDVGGAADSGPTGINVTKSDNPDEEDGMNGYDENIISDGRLDNETPVLWVRISPTNNKHVQFALKYGALGFTQANLKNLRYFHFEAIKGGPKDPQNYLWNDKYTKQEAGSPNPGPGGQSEFGTEGLKDIYEVDTARGGPIRVAATAGQSGPDSDTLDVMRAIIAGEDWADFNNDGFVNGQDLISFLNSTSDDE